MELLDKYAYTVYEEMSFTEASKKLYISQPALSAALARHEKALGFQIFNRRTSPIKLTAKGRIYIESLAKIISIEASRNLRLQELDDVQQYDLAVGCSKSEAYSILPDILAALYMSHPNISVRVDIGNVGTLLNLHQKLESGKIDLYLDNFKPHFDCSATLLREEELMIAASHTVPIPDELRDYALSYDELCTAKHTKKRVQNTKPFQSFPFVRYGITKEGMGSKMQELIGDYHILPIHTANSRNNLMHHYLVRAGAGAAFTTVESAKKFFSAADNVTYFLFDDERAKWKLYLYCNPIYPQTRAMKAFIEIALQVCSGQA